jgi:hemolysin activation/secretion protein
LPAGAACEQELNQGVVHLKVIETRIGKIRVAGNSFHSMANIRRSLPALEEGVIPNTGDLSADIRISNENPSKKVNLQLQSGERPGVIDAVVQVIDDKTWTAGARSCGGRNDTREQRRRRSKLCRRPVRLHT